MIVLGPWKINNVFTPDKRRVRGQAFHVHIPLLAVPADPNQGLIARHQLLRSLDKDNMSFGFSRIKTDNVKSIGSEVGTNGHS